MLPIYGAIQKYDGKRDCSDWGDFNEIEKAYLLLFDNESYLDSCHGKEQANQQSVDEH